jgi:hypothetical protein
MPQVDARSRPHVAVTERTVLAAGRCLCPHRGFGREVEALPGLMGCFHEERP